MIKRLSIAIGTALVATFAYLASDLTLFRLPIVKSVEIPDMALPVLMQDGVVMSHKELQLRELVGKPVLVHWWASWCTICKVELPEIFALFNEMRAANSDLQFIAIATSDEYDAAASAAQLLSFPYAVLFDRSSDVAKRFGANGVPYLCLISASGQSRYCWQGSLSGGKIRDVKIAINKI